jgi:phosphatidylinositol alpha-1,6-mannosyltransferase
VTNTLSVLSLVTECFGGRGGIAQYNRDLMTALAHSGLLASNRILPRTAPERVTLGLPVTEQLPARAGKLAYTIGALKTAMTRSVDMVFCGHLYMAPLAAFIARQKHAKLVIQTHGIEAWEKPTRMQRAALQTADLVLCVSRYTRARVLSWAGIPPERAIVLPNTVGEAFAPGPSPLRETWKLGGKRVLLTVGRLDSRERYKGHESVIAALPELIVRGHDVVYAVIGEGDDIERLRTVASKTGMAERVLFVGAVDEATLVAAYRCADLFVMPSTGEGFGIAYLEAMASGMPALGLSVAGALDSLADGTLGTAVQPDKLVTAIADLLAAPKPDPNALAQAVRGRFGQPVFSRCVQSSLGRLMEPA